MSSQDILVVAETNRGQVADISLEMLTAARALATETGGQVHAVLLAGDDSVPADALAAADQVLLVQDPLLAGFAPTPMLAVLENLIARVEPRAVLIGSTSAGLDLGPLLGARLDRPVVNNCLQVTADGDVLRLTAGICGGKLLVDLTVTAAPAILLMSPGAFAAARGEQTANVRSGGSPLPLEPGDVLFQEMTYPDTSDVDITQQDVLVAVGRGIQQEDNLEIAERLAELLGGAVAASRPIIDQGWLPPTRQVGKSGMTVKPKCFLALGISGAPEHVEGMKDADLIVAVNTDANAPIFEVAHYGVVGDLEDVTEALTELLEERKVST